MDVPRVMKLLSDDSRLRLLALLGEEELAVQELVEITGMGQSRVSRHLGQLREAGVVRDRREGTWTFYRLATPNGNGETFSVELWNLVRGQFRNSGVALEDSRELERVREARRERSRSAHDRLAGVWRVVGEQLERGSLRAEVLAALATPELVVADLGCGAGFFSGYLAGRVSRAIAVDHSEAMLRETRASVPKDVPLELRQGELDALPLADEEVDGVIANLVFHHVPEFGAVAREVARVLRPGGTGVITDLLPHTEEWMREEMGDPRLGIEVEELVEALEGAPFSSVEILPVEDRYRLKGPGGRIARLELFMIRVRK